MEKQLKFKVVCSVSVAVVNVVSGILIALFLLTMVVPSCLIHGARTVSAGKVLWQICIFQSQDSVPKVYNPATLPRPTRAC